MKLAIPNDWKDQAGGLLASGYFSLRLQQFPITDKILSKPMKEWVINTNDVRMDVIAKEIAFYPVADHYLQIQLPAEFPARKLIVFPDTHRWGSFLMLDREMADVRFFMIFSDEASVFVEREGKTGLEFDEPDKCYFSGRQIEFSDDLGAKRKIDTYFRIPNVHFKKPYFWFGQVYREAHVAVDLERGHPVLSSCEDKLAP